MILTCTLRPPRRILVIALDAVDKPVTNQLLPDAVPLQLLALCTCHFGPVAGDCVTEELGEHVTRVFAVFACRIYGCVSEAYGAQSCCGVRYIDSNRRSYNET